MMYAVEMASCGITCLPSFIKIGTGVQAILGGCLSNLNGYNTGISDGQNLSVVPLR
jgi:hypothetical protein